jgi:methylated-DNA-[protein]-cysteine S-methyltransferase
MHEVHYYSLLTTPVGEVLLTSDGESLTGLHMEPHEPVEGRRDDATLRTAREQLHSYFAGELQDFTVPLAQQGTPFQQRVWAALRKIPYGTTISYAELAQRVGQPGAARAVGSANGRNSIGIIIPCHRVIAADGTLGGYGGGLDRKRWLLDHEQEVVRQQQGTARRPRAARDVRQGASR